MYPLMVESLLTAAVRIRADSLPEHRMSTTVLGLGLAGAGSKCASLRKSAKNRSSICTLRMTILSTYPLIVRASSAAFSRIVEASSLEQAINKTARATPVLYHLIYEFAIPGLL
jgi:hypothetical protein